jgi:Nitrous oxide-stimulated promoter
MLDNCQNTEGDTLKNSAATKFDTKVSQETKTIQKMIAIYCRSKHQKKKELCPACANLQEYASARIKACPFGETKTFCSVCTVHCYQPEMREHIRTVMRFSGPRMIFYSPVLTIRHFLSTHKKAPTHKEDHR